ncbi:unnamed protein product [Effrenium voratum]|nr:unnamed protein product [Effrenium voratum]
MLSPPFSEEIVQFCPERFDFPGRVQELLHRDLVQDAGESVPLGQVHLRFEGHRPRLRAPLAKDGQFAELYLQFLREVVRANLGEEALVFERSPNLRVHLAGEKSLTAPHRDKDHQHSEAEINWWVPLTCCQGEASLWAESAPGKGDFHSFDVQPGQAVRFYGNQCLHFAKDNRTDASRLSFDFRVIRLRDLHWSQVPLPGSERKARWMLFSYYDIMGPDGSILRADAWPSMLPLPLGTQPPLLGEAQLVQSPATRSPSPEHQRRCLERFGSLREARKACARCGYMASRASLRRLCFLDAGGQQRPWLAESSAEAAPWGLGCRLCAAAAEAHEAEAEERGEAARRRSVFASFSFGVIRRERTSIRGVVRQSFPKLRDLCP